MPWTLWESSKDGGPICSRPDCTSNAYGNGLCLRCLQEQDKDKPIREMSRKTALSLDEHHACR